MTTNPAIRYSSPFTYGACVNFARSKRDEYIILMHKFDAAEELFRSYKELMKLPYKTESMITQANTIFAIITDLLRDALVYLFPNFKEKYRTDQYHMIHNAILHHPDKLADLATIIGVNWKVFEGEED